jgi:hypothetical protein
MTIPSIVMNTNFNQYSHISIPGAQPLGSPHAANIASHVSSNHLNNYVEGEKRQSYQPPQGDDIIAVLDEDAILKPVQAPLPQPGKSNSPKPVSQKPKRASPPKNLESSPKQTTTTIKVPPVVMKPEKKAVTSHKAKKSMSPPQQRAATGAAGAQHKKNASQAQKKAQKTQGKRKNGGSDDDDDEEDYGKEYGYEQ